MTDETNELDLTADDLRVRDAVRALSRPEADAGFRAQLRDSFINGAIDAAPRETVRRTSPAPLPMWRKLAPIAERLQSHVNVIALNPTPLSPDRPSRPERIESFMSELNRLGVNSTLRHMRGQDIDAACGQLRARSEPKRGSAQRVEIGKH